MSIRNLLNIAVLATVLTIPDAMATDWLKIKQHWRYPTTERAVSSPQSAEGEPAAGSIEAWRKAKQPALVVSDGHVLAVGERTSVPKLDAIEAWKQAKFSHLQKSTKR